jgi:hypothetical protein
LLLARADADLADTDRLHDVAAARPSRRKHTGQGTTNPAVTAENLTGTVVRASRTAAKTADLLSTTSIVALHAAQLADDLEAALPALIDLQRRLRLRGRLGR